MPIKTFGKTASAPMGHRGFPDPAKLGIPDFRDAERFCMMSIEAKEAFFMLTTAIEETSDFGQICLTPQIEDWRRKLEHTCRHLMPWACSAQMLPMWVSDYGKVCRLANSLNMKIDELFKLTSQDFPTDAIANASVVAAIDHTIDEIGQIGRRIETELHDSIGGSDQPTRTNTNWPSFHRQSW